MERFINESSYGKIGRYEAVSSFTEHNGYDYTPVQPMGGYTSQPAEDEPQQQDEDDLPY